MARSGRYLCLLAALPFLAVLLMTGGCGATRPTDTAQDTPTVALGGYTFSSTSNVLTHRWFAANPKTPKATSKGWGSEKGRQLTATFSDGGLVAGVKTLRVTMSDGASSMWLAQDTQGNIHYLAVLDHRIKRARGVAVARQGPWFFLVKALQLKRGATWTKHSTNPNDVDWVQDVVMSTNATFRGKPGLLYVRDIIDTNGNHRFDPSWTGHDTRMDQYFGRGGHYAGIQVSATGGYGP